MGDTLAFRSDEGRGLPTKYFGELETMLRSGGIRIRKLLELFIE
jgi:hypothetical protein